jgi:hypothetical protein
LGAFFWPFFVVVVEKLASLDDSSPKNLGRLVKLSHDLLDESVAICNFETGELEPISSGEMNREALHRYANPNPNST